MPVQPEHVLKPPKKTNDGVLEVEIQMDDSWCKDAERIAAYGEPNITVRFNWLRRPTHWDPFGSWVSCQDILRTLNTVFEAANFPGRARTLSSDRICVITEVSILDLMDDKHAR